LDVPSGGDQGERRGGDEVNADGALRDGGEMKALRCQRRPPFHPQGPCRSLRGPKSVVCGALRAFELPPDAFAPPITPVF
jgi:hypothetical protein